MSAEAAALLVGGAALELVGIVLVGSPDLMPYGLRFSAWLKLRVQQAVNRFMRLIGRPRRTVVGAGAAVLTAVGLGARGVVSISEEASLEAKVGFLLRRDKEVQGRIDDLSERITAMEGQTADDLAALQEQMENHVAESLKASHRLYLPLRLFGVALLVAGLGCVTAASFVS